MKLYYLTGACSLASYISLIEAGQKFEGFSVDRATRQAADGKDFATIGRRWGFNEPASFSRAFRAAFGDSPAGYRAAAMQTSPRVSDPRRP